jgi:hypothetical protein
MSRKKKENKALSKEDDAFFTYEEEKKDLGTLLPNKNDTSNTKNTIYVFKDKSTTTVCYDGKNVNYITVHMNS